MTDSKLNQVIGILKLQSEFPIEYVAKLICDLFQQPVEGELISDKEIKEVVKEWFKTSPLFEVLALMGAQAQLALAQQALEEQQQKHGEAIKILIMGYEAALQHLRDTRL